MHWQTSRRQISLDRPLVMAILNVTPDSFSDGGEFMSVDDALRRAETMIAEGADIIDIGGESTRPGSTRIDPETEKRRTMPVIDAVANRFDIPLSIDTSKSKVARAALDAGAEIINDISGLRWDKQIADVAAATGAGLVLMHSRGSFDEMHSLPPVDDILADVTADFRRSIHIAGDCGVANEQMVLDVGIGFGKTQAQNLELLGKLDTIVSEFEHYPMLVAASRKSFIGKILNDSSVDERLGGSLACAAIAIFNGAKMIRVHDVKETVDVVKIAAQIGRQRT